MFFKNSRFFTKNLSSLAIQFLALNLFFAISSLIAMESQYIGETKEKAEKEYIVNLISDIDKTKLSITYKATDKIPEVIQRLLAAKEREKLEKKELDLKFLLSKKLLNILKTVLVVDAKYEQLEDQKYENLIKTFNLDLEEKIQLYDALNFLAINLTGLGSLIFDDLNQDFQGDKQAFEEYIEESNFSDELKIALAKQYFYRFGVLESIGQYVNRKDQFLNISINYGFSILDLVRNNKLPKVMKYISPLGKEINRLSLKDLKINSLEGLSVLPKNIHTLDLSSNQISIIKSNAFKNLTNLNTLVLTNNQISTIEPNAFEDLTNLRELYLRENQISAQTIEQIKKLLPNTEIFAEDKFAGDF